MSEQAHQEDRQTGISLSGRKIRHRDSFLDHPLYIAGAVLFGILLGVGVMYGTTIGRTASKAAPTPKAVEVVVDGSATDEPTAATSPSP